MTENNIINEEELEKVTGGSLGTEGIEDPGAFCDFVDMYTLHEKQNFNQEYYFVTYGSNKKQGMDTTKKVWFRARLVNSYEKWNWFITNSTHDIRITERGTSDYSVGDAVEISGDSHAAYRSRAW